MLFWYTDLAALDVAIIESNTIIEIFLIKHFCNCLNLLLKKICFLNF